MISSRTTTTLLAVILAFSIVLPQNTEAQDPQRTEHLRPWSEIDFSEIRHIQLEKKNEDCLVARVTNIPGRKRYLFYFNSEFATGRAVVNDRMRQAVHACTQIIRGYVGPAHAVTFFGTDNAVPNRQSAEMPLSETTSPEREQANDFRLAQLRANTGRNLVISALADVALKNAGNYIPAKYETATVSAPDSLQRLESLSDQASLEFGKRFFGVADVYDSGGAISESAFDERISNMKDDVSQRFSRVHSRIDSLADEHRQTRKIVRDNSEDIDSLEQKTNRAMSLAKDANDTSVDLGGFVGGGISRFANINTPTGEIGLRVGDAEFSAWYGRKSKVGSADLRDGQVSIHRESYGGSVTWYPNPLDLGRVEFGATAAFEHGEDYLDGKEEYVRGYESGQIGVSANIRLIGPLALHGGVRYSVTQSFESTDLQLVNEDSRFRAGATLRLTF